MILPEGVFIPAEHCGLVAEFMAVYLERGRQASPLLHRLLGELMQTAAVSADGSRQWAPVVPLPDTEVMTVKEYAPVVGLGVRRVRQMCQTGQLEAFQNASGHWQIPIKETA